MRLLKTLAAALVVGAGLAGLLLVMAAATCAQVDSEAADPAPLEKYLPDRHTPDWRPDDRTPAPERHRTIYAERIVLEGRDVTITLDARGPNPGILIASRRSGQAARVYIDGRGNAAVGVQTPASRQMTAALLAGADGRRGYLQLRDTGGVDMLSGAELTGRRPYRGFSGDGR